MIDDPSKYAAITFVYNEITGDVDCGCSSKFYPLYTSLPNPIEDYIMIGEDKIQEMLDRVKALGKQPDAKSLKIGESRANIPLRLFRVDQENFILTSRYFRPIELPEIGIIK